jgi:hypothetical protein
MKKKMNMYEVYYDTFKIFLIGGTAFIKLTWQSPDKDMGEDVSRPMVKSINPDAIRYDWTAKSFMDSHVVTHEEDITKSELIQMKGAKGVIDSRVDKALQTQGSATKTDRLRDERVENKAWVGEQQARPSEAMGLYLRREQWTMYDLVGDGIARPVMAVFINNILVQIMGNPYKFKRPPFVAAECVRDPFGNPAVGWSAALSEIQKFRTALLRMVSDNLNAQQNGIYEVDRNNVDDIAFQLLRHAPQGSRTPIPVRKPGSINPLSPAPLANHVLSAWEMMAVEGENRSGNTRYSQGLDSKSLNQTATGIVSITQRSEMRMWEIAMRFSETALKPLVRMIIALNQQKLDKQSIEMQFGVSVKDKDLRDYLSANDAKAELKAGEWVTISREDIGGYFTVDLDVKVGSDKQTRINNLMQYLQFVSPFVGQGVPPEAISIVAMELAKEMGLNQIQAVLGGDFVGARGVAVHRSIIGGGMPQVAGAQTGGGGGVGSTEGQSGFLPTDPSQVLGAGQGGSG